MVENRSIKTAKFSTILNETENHFSKRDKIQIVLFILYELYFTEHILEYHES